MKLIKAQILEFKSVWDSNAFQIDQLTCLVGKNEAGKTALLQALYRLNPIVPTDGVLNVTNDYPRSSVEDYLQAIESEERDPATVVSADFQLEEEELEAVAAVFGEGAIVNSVVTLTKKYGDATFTPSFRTNEASIVRALIELADLPAPDVAAVGTRATVSELAKFLSNSGKEKEKAVAEARAAAAALGDTTATATAIEESKKLSESEQAKALRERLSATPDIAAIHTTIWGMIKKGVPRFLYFDDYYQMKGHENIQALRARKAAKQPLPSDHPLLGLIDLARLDLDKLVATTSTQELKNKLQGASNYLSAQVLKYWSQNKHLRMDFDVRTAMPGDPEGMRDGMNIWGDVFDSRHQVSTGLGTRSRGFVWFFSFLAWYSGLKKDNQRIVLLLDEPGTSLHGRAQEDLLRFFEAEILSNPKHQLIYTTHSPFMVDSRRYDRVRIVQDKGIDSPSVLPREEDGTKVFTDVLEAGPDSLFPLQGALGYEIYQTLFVGPNSLLVEGVSDLLYLQTVSGMLRALNREGLDAKWTITPVGGSQKVSTFVALLGSQKNLTVATLIDFQAGDRQSIENLYKKKLLKQSHVLTFADFTGTTEADIEDMFDATVYLKIVNSEFSTALAAPLKSRDISGTEPRILVRLEKHFANAPLKDGAKFNHYRPARRFAENPTQFKVSEDALNRFETAFKALNELLSV